MAAISSDLTPEEVLGALARNVVTNGYQASHSNEALEQTEYLKLVHRYLSQARELEKLAGADKILKVENCESESAGGAKILGYRMRGGCGSEVVLETVNASRAFLTTDSGFALSAKCAGWRHRGSWCAGLANLEIQVPRRLHAHQGQVSFTWTYQGQHVLLDVPLAGGLLDRFRLEVRAGAGRLHLYSRDGPCCSAATVRLPGHGSDVYPGPRRSHSHATTSRESGGERASDSPVQSGGSERP